MLAAVIGGELVSQTFWGNGVRMMDAWGASAQFWNQTSGAEELQDVEFE